jgi:hypothetical protein
MRAVNLLPRDAARDRKSLSQQNAPVLLGAGLGVVVTGALALGFLHETSAVTAAHKQLEAARKQLAATPRPVQATVKPDPNAALVGQESARVTAVTTALGARFAWDRVLREFSLVLPDDITLSSLSLSAPDPNAPAAAGAGTTPQDFVIVGTTYSHDSVARLLARLALIPELSDVTLQGDSASSGGPAAAGGSSAASGPISFTINASINLPPGATSLTAPPPPPPVIQPSTDSSGAPTS